MRSLATLAGIVLLGGACTDARLVDSVSQLKPKESGFKANLHKEYVDLAKLELDEGDIYDTGVFARRAEAAAMGKGVDPDVLWDRSYSKKNRGTLFKERDRLLAALNGGGRSDHPALAARAGDVRLLGARAGRKQSAGRHQTVPRRLYEGDGSTGGGDEAEAGSEAEEESAEEDCDRKSICRLFRFR